MHMASNSGIIMSLPFFSSFLDVLRQHFIEQERLGDMVTHAGYQEREEEEVDLEAIVETGFTKTLLHCVFELVPKPLRFVHCTVPRFLGVN